MNTEINHFRRRRQSIILIALCLPAVLGSSLIGAGGQSKQSAKSAEVTSKSWVERTLESMPSDEKIGQLIVPATIGMFLSQDSEAFQEIERNITRFHVGGYHMLGDAVSLHEPAGAALLINHMQERARTPLLITADFEGGVGLRYSGATRLPRAMALGAAANEEMAFAAGRITAEEARAMGVNVNFYPIVDVNNNPRNPIINIRSFGGDPAQVSRMARAYIRGSRQGGVMATAKHFPGHGDTSTDSHLELPVIDADRARLDQIELPPFRAAIEEGVGGVMSAHIALPRLEPDNLPATLSSKILTGLLRNEMGFQGIVFTDALTMRGVSAHYPDGEAAVLAVKAGADVLLFPPDVEKAFNAIKAAVQSGAITEERLNESVRRILNAKARLGLDKNRFTDLNQLDRVLGGKEHQTAARQIIENAITLVRNERNTLPLKLSPEQSVLFVTVVDDADGWREGAPGKTFLSSLTARHRKTSSVFISDRASPGELDLAAKLAELADVVVVTCFVRVSAYRGSVELVEGQIEMLKRMAALKKPLAFVLFGSPYLLMSAPELPTYVLAYEYYPAAEEAALKAVLGENPFKGRLPVEIPGYYRMGHSAVK